MFFPNFDGDPDLSNVLLNALHQGVRIPIFRISYEIDDGLYYNGELPLYLGMLVFG